MERSQLWTPQDGMCQHVPTITYDNINHFVPCRINNTSTLSDRDNRSISLFMKQEFGASPPRLVEKSRKSGCRLNRLQEDERGKRSFKSTEQLHSKRISLAGSAADGKRSAGATATIWFSQCFFFTRRRLSTELFRILRISTRTPLTPSKKVLRTRRDSNVCIFVASSSTAAGCLL